MIKPKDCYQTPPTALLPLLPYLTSFKTIWEPAMGKGNIVNGELLQICP
jgi:hypothetical protein